MKESEKETELYLAEQVEAHGGLCRKYTSPGMKNVPDRLCIMEYGILYFVETKSEGDEPNGGQKREHKRLTDRGHLIYVIDTKAKVDKLIKEYLCTIEMYS